MLFVDHLAHLLNKLGVVSLTGYIVVEHGHVFNGEQAGRKKILLRQLLHLH